MADANIIVIGGNADDQDHDIPDNTNPAWRVHQGGTDYIAIATTNSAECVKLVSSGTGRVSIGTHDPYTNIDAAADNLVVGDGSGDEGITIVSGSGAGDYASIFFGDSSSGTQGQLRYEQNNEVMSFHTNTSERMRIDLNGDVGIGMTSPDLKLVVHGDDTSGVVSVRNASNGRDTLKSENAAGNRTFNIGNDASGHGILLVRNSSGTTNTYIAGSGDSYFNAGDVGIGTDSPASELHVIGEGLLGNATSKLASYGILELSRAGNPYLFLRNTNSEGVNNSGVIEFYQKNGNGSEVATSRIGGATEATHATQPSGYINFSTASAGGSMSEKMRITSDGDVGIGTTSPGTKLEIKGTDGLLQLNTDSATGQPYLSFAQGDTRRSFIQHVDSSDMLKIASEYGGINFFTGINNLETEKMRIASGGNVGIGTSSPIAQLHLQKNAGDALLLLQCNDSSFGVDEIYGKIDFGNRNYDDRICSIVAAQEAACNSGATANGYLAFFTEASGGDIGERMRIASGGNVGIGVTNPAHAIDVSGTAGLSTGTAWTNTSDSRVKQNVETIENALEKIEALRPVSFEYTQDYVDCTDGIVAGQRYNSFIAQEYAEVFPDAVSVGPDLVKESPEEEPVVLLSDLKQFTPHDLNMYLVRAVQELSAQIKELKEGK